jgi:hypothetical protein
VLGYDPIWKYNQGIFDVTLPVMAEFLSLSGWIPFGIPKPKPISIKDLTELVLVIWEIIAP